MNKLIPGNVYSAKNRPAITKLYKTLKVFPTPFKGIYYVPFDSERSGWYISKPQEVLFATVALYLNSSDYYFGLYSALYYLRIIWNSFGIDIINKKLSRKVCRKLPSTKYWRGKTINKIMKSYPFPIRFHRMINFSFSGTVIQTGIKFSNDKKTKSDAFYLCKKGDKTACEVLNKLKNRRTH